MPHSNFVFLDPHGRRWPIFRRVMLLSGALLGLALVLFIAAVWIRPAVRLPAVVREMKGQLKANRIAPVADPKALDWQQYVAQSRAAQERLAATRTNVEPPAVRPPVRLGFYGTGDANAWRSLRLHADRLTHVAADWMTLASVESTLQIEPDAQLRDFCHAHALPLLGILRNLAGDIWQPEAVEELARADPARQKAFAETLAAKLRESGAAGVLIDFNELDPS